MVAVSITRPMPVMMEPREIGKDTFQIVRHSAAQLPRVPRPRPRLAAAARAGLRRRE